MNSPNNPGRPIQILLVESIHSVAAEELQKQGFHVDLLSHAPSEKELNEKLPSYDVLGIRSKTEVTESVLRSNPHLLAVGCFCIGTNQVRLGVANQLGVPVFNAPHSNTRSVAEMVLAEMIMLARHLGDQSAKTHLGAWEKSATGAFEVRGKVLGIVGYGHIGSQLSILAESLGLRVVFFDIVKKLPLGNAQSMSSLAELLRNSDFVSLHVPKTPQTQSMITKSELSRMKKGSYLINASRGDVVVIEDLVSVLKSEHLAGAALDVFPSEPASTKEKFKSPLQGLSNVILTPHIGGSTEEAQHAIGQEVAESFRKFLKLGTTAGAVNFPNLDLPIPQKVLRIVNIHRNEPGVLGEINGLISDTGSNINAQFLATDSQIGYLVVDIEGENQRELAQAISKLSRSIRTRVISNEQHPYY